MRHTVTITLDSCGEETRERITLPPAALRTNTEIGTGCWLRAIYVGPKSKRVIVETFSQWVRSPNDGRQIGTRFHEADADEIAKLAAEYPEISEKLDKIVVPTEL